MELIQTHFSSETRIKNIYREGAKDAKEGKNKRI